MSWCNPFSRRDRSSALRAGFTILELLVSIAILLIISLSVVNDINRTRYQEELQGSARMVVATLHDLQTKALSGGGIKTCTGASGLTAVCEYTSAECQGACGTLLTPYALGAKFLSAPSATGVIRFAEVDPALANRQEASSVPVAPVDWEDIGWLSFAQATRGLDYVKITSLTTSNGAGTWLYVTFERQSGAMRINACGAAPLTGCGAFPEPTTAIIVLTHSKTGSTRTIRLNALTGKISLE